METVKQNTSNDYLRKMKSLKNVNNVLLLWGVFYIICQIINQQYGSRDLTEPEKLQNKTGNDENEKAIATQQRNVIA